VRACALLAVIAVATATACTRGDAAIPHDAGAPATPPSVAAPPASGSDTAAAPLIAAAVSVSDTADPAQPPLEPGMLPSVRAVEVVGRTAPDGSPFEVAVRAPGDVPHARSFGRRTLPLALRDGVSGMRQYPCTSCHTGRRVDLRDDRTAGAHEDITIRHPLETGATCGTCHAAADVALLALRSGEVAPLAHAYRVCAQCHYAQADAWAAGVHGKRLDGWQGRRVVMGCTDCHDPHAPTLDARLPFRAPTIHQRQGRFP
jgi:hypothetical protein